MPRRKKNQSAAAEGTSEQGPAASQRIPASPQLAPEEGKEQPSLKTGASAEDSKQQCKYF